MNHALKTSISDDLTELVSELLVEFRGFDGPNERVLDRDYLTCSVLIEPGVGAESFRGFSRDISAVGIGLITEEKIELESTATLSVERFDGTRVKLRAICRWCRPYGPNWNLTGWEFQSLIGVRRY